MLWFELEKHAPKMIMYRYLYKKNLGKLPINTNAQHSLHHHKKRREEDKENEKNGEEKIQRKEEH